MKHLRIFVGIVATLLCCITASAYTFMVDNIYYNYNLTSLTVEVTYKTTSYNSYSGDVVIPATVTYSGMKLTVASIGENAFRNCSSLTSIVIPEGVTSIGNHAFNGCNSLTSMTIPASVTSIGCGAFDDCVGIKELIFVDGTETLSLSNGFDKADYCSLFKHCSLEKLYLGRNLDAPTSDSMTPFYDQKGLSSVIVSDDVTSIISYAFMNCSSLTSITIPESVTSIGNKAFSGCGNITDIHIASIESWLAIEYASDSDRPNVVSSNIRLYLDGEELTEVEIPSSVSSIPSYAFYNCSYIASVTISEGVTSIGNYAFSGCCSLTSITIPESVTSIGNNAFSGCSSLASIAISENSKLTLIGDRAFYNCSSLTSVTIPEGVTSIGNSAFSGCTGLTSITIPNSVTSIGYSAFSGCTGLTSITIPNSVTSIEHYAFSGCVGLTSITIPNSVTSIGDYAFSGCVGLTSITIPNGVTSIGYSAFSDCVGLTSITIPNSVTSIDNYAFSGCIALENIVFEDGDKILSLGYNATNEGLFFDCPLVSVYLGRDLSYGTDSRSGYSPFYNNSTLASFTITDNVESIGDYLLMGCVGLTSITIPNGVTSIGDGAFSGCVGLTSITIPNGVTSIGDYLLMGCTGLTSITIPEGVTSIGGSAFEDCSSLTSITIPEGVTSIGDYAFSGCVGLTSITISNSVTSIGYGAFKACSVLDNVVLKSTTPPVLGSSSLAEYYTMFRVPAESYDDYISATYWSDLVSQITILEVCEQDFELTADGGKSALQIAIGDENLKYVTDLTISGTINSYDFMIMRNKMPLLHHLDLSEANIVKNDYEHYTGYHTENDEFPGYGLYGCGLFTLALPKSIKNIGDYAIARNVSLLEVAFFEGVTRIGEHAFYLCPKLTAVSLPKGLTLIGRWAFDGCSKLTTINFPDGLKIINPSAFYNCTSLSKVILPPSVEDIGYGAFSGCGNLTEIRIPSSVRSLGDQAFSGCSNLNDVYVYTVEPISIGQNTFSKDGNNFKGTLHAPKVSYWDYYYDTQWSQFANFIEFDEPYDNFYVEGDKELNDNTGSVGGTPDVEMGDNSGIIVDGDTIKQDFGDVDIENDGNGQGGSIIVGGNGEVNAEKINFRIHVKGGKWYFFCFPFDIKMENIKCEGGASYVFRYYDGACRAQHGKGGWKDVEGDQLNAWTGYIFQASANDVLVLTVENKRFDCADRLVEIVEHVAEAVSKLDASWNFIGNPNLSYYDLNDLAEQYSAPITIWNGSQYVAVRPGDDDHQFAPFEGFFVQKPSGTDCVEFKNENQMTYNQSKAAAAQARARRRNQEINPERLLVNVTLSDGENTDQTRVVFNDKVSMEYEIECDAAKFTTAGVPQIYTIDSRAAKYAINERPVAEGIVTVGYSVPAQGVYTLAAPRMDTPIYIKDNLTGTLHDFAEGSYEFASEEGTFDDRFTIVMKAAETGIENSGFDSEESAIYNTKGQRVEGVKKHDVYIKGNRKVVSL